MPTALGGCRLIRIKTTMKSEKTLLKEIKRVKKEIGSLGELFPGSISQQFNICGNPDCRCKDKKEPVKHGPYNNLSYTFRGRRHTKFIREELVEEFGKYTSNYKKYKQYTDELVGFYIELINLRSKR